MHISFTLLSTQVRAHHNLPPTLAPPRHHHHTIFAVVVLDDARLPSAVTPAYRRLKRNPRPDSLTATGGAALSLDHRTVLQQRSLRLYVTTTIVAVFLPEPSDWF